MRRFYDVSAAVAGRSIRAWYGNPAFLVPSVVFPLFFLVAFAGGLSSVGKVPGFNYPPGYTAFQFVFVFLQASAFGGVFTGFAIAADFEFGFARRLLLAAPNRLAILSGYAAAALMRALATGAMVFLVALAVGMNVQGDGVDLAGLAVLGLLLSGAAMLFGSGVAFRARTIQAGPAMQMPVFLLLFLAPVYVPRELLRSWLRGAADVNPITPLIEAGRGLLAGFPIDVALAFGVGAALVAVTLAWAVRGLRKAEAAG